MMILARLLLLLLLTARRVTASATTIARQVQEDEVAAVYEAVYIPLPARCTATDESQVVTFFIECGEGGRVEMVEEGDTTPSLDCTVNTDDETIMTCRRFRQSDSPIEAVVIAYRCVAPATAPATAWQTAVQVPERTDLTCVVSDYFRTLGIYRRCDVPDTIGRSNTFEVSQPMCLGDDAAQIQMFTAGACTTVVSCSLNADPNCGTSIPTLAIFVADTSVPDFCQQSVSRTPPSGSTIADRTTFTPLDATLRLQYFVTWSAARVGQNCASAEVGQTNIRCGNGGRIDILGLVINDGEDEATALANAGCIRAAGDTTLQCLLSQVPDEQFAFAVTGSSLEFTCQGSTLESLALEVDYDPGSIECAFPDSNGSSVLAYTVQILQYCPDLTPATIYLVSPFDKAPTFFGQECAVPAETDAATSVAYDWVDLNSNGIIDICEDTNNDGFQDRCEIVEVPVESCLRTRYNCQGEFTSYCDNGGTSQAVGVIRNRYALDTVVTDPVCQVPLVNGVTTPLPLTLAPVVAPILATTASPVAATTLAPVAEPILATTASPVAAATLAPVAEPILATTASPVAATTLAPVAPVPMPTEPPTTTIEPPVASPDGMGATSAATTAMLPNTISLLRLGAWLTILVGTASCLASW